MANLISSMKENALFLAVCVAVTAAVFVLAIVSEKAGHYTRSITGTRRMAFIAMCSALAGVLMVLDFPVPIAPGFYKLDLGDLPALVSGLWMGPVAGVTVELLKVVLKVLIKGTSSAFVGEFASFLTGSVLLLPAAILYMKKSSRKALALSLAVSTVVMVTFASLFNVWYLLPRYAELYGMPLETILAAGTAIWPSVTGMATFALLIVAPFNLLKALILDLVTFLIHPRLHRALGRNR